MRPPPTSLRSREVADIYPCHRLRLDDRVGILARLLNREAGQGKARDDPAVFVPDSGLRNPSRGRTRCRRHLVGTQLDAAAAVLVPEVGHGAHPRSPFTIQTQPDFSPDTSLPYHREIPPRDSPESPRRGRAARWQSHTDGGSFQRSLDRVFLVRRPAPTTARRRLPPVCRRRMQWPPGGHRGAGPRSRDREPLDRWPSPPAPARGVP